MMPATTGRTVAVGRRGLRGTGRWLAGLLPLAAGLLIWELTSGERSLSFPPPSTWWPAGKKLWQDGSLLPALGSTLTTFALAMVVATVGGVAAGLFIGSHPRVERALTPLMDFFRTLPPPVVVPVLTLVLGITREASVAIVVTAVIWPVILNTVNAVREMPSVRREIAPVLGLSRFAAFWKIFLPSVISGAVVGVRTALSLALVITLLVDIIGSADGIGRLLVEQQQFFRAPAVWALLFVIGLVGYLLSVAIYAATRLLLRHHPPQPGR